MFVVYRMRVALSSSSKACTIAPLSATFLQHTRPPDPTGTSLLYHCYSRSFASPSYGHQLQSVAWILMTNSLVLAFLAFNLYLMLVLPAHLLTTWCSEETLLAFSKKDLSCSPTPRKWTSGANPCPPDNSPQPLRTQTRTVLPRIAWIWITLGCPHCRKINGCRSTPRITVPRGL